MLQWGYRCNVMADVSVTVVETMVDRRSVTTDHEADSQDVETRIRSMLDSLKNAAEVATDTLVDYHERLETFRPSTYFAKPPSLSPIVCARFGWKNAAEDLVVCSECNSSIVIQIHPNLSTSAARDVCQAIEAELAKAHALDCSFRSDAEKHFLILSKDDVNESNMVPAFIASVLTPSVLEFMEHPSPQQSLHDRVMTLVEYVGLDDNDESESSNDGCKLRPVVEIPRELLQFGVSNEDNQTQDSELLPCIKRILELPEVDVQAIALALLGWEPSLTETASGAHSIQVKCQVCLATADVVLEDNISPTEDGATSIEPTAVAGEAVDAVANPSKRQRTSSASAMNPILSHRHYCPFVCGFPRTGSWSSTPLWKVIATRILQTYANLSDPSYRAENSEERIHTMLKAGIASNSPNRVR